MTLFPELVIVAAATAPTSLQDGSRTSLLSWESAEMSIDDQPPPISRNSVVPVLVEISAEVLSNQSSNSLKTTERGLRGFSPRIIMGVMLLTPMTSKVDIRTFGSVSCYCVLLDYTWEWNPSGSFHRLEKGRLVCGAGQLMTSADVMLSPVVSQSYKTSHWLSVVCVLSNEGHTMVQLMG